jgi:CBS-domain-containing membrane protein
LRAVTLADPPWRGSLARVPLTELTLRGAYQTVRIDAQMEELLAMAAHQNFVPVVDDREVFVGIVRRQIIIEYFTQQFGVNLSDSDAASS